MGKKSETPPPGVIQGTTYSQIPVTQLFSLHPPQFPGVPRPCLSEETTLSENDLNLKKQ